MPLGNDKYGGLLIVEEVEDVKAILEVIPLVTCIAASVHGLTYLPQLKMTPVSYNIVILCQIW